MHPDPQATFRALSDPTRREILHILSSGEKTIGQIAECFAVSRPAIKKHLTILQDGALIGVTKRGRTRVNYLKKDGFVPVTNWLSIFDSLWDDRLATLKSTIEKELN